MQHCCASGRGRAAPPPAFSLPMTSTPTPAQPSDRVLEALQISLRGCDELLPQADWLKKLMRSEATGQPLRIKLGLDPTAPEIGRAHV